MVGAILGKMDNNIQQVCIGVYAMFYNIFMLFFRFFGKNGLIMPFGNFIINLLFIFQKKVNIKNIYIYYYERVS